MAAQAPFRAEHRLHTPGEYAVVFAERRVLRGEWFQLHVGPGGTGARLGLVISKKNARRAVLRNLVKRIAREVFRHARAGLPAADVVLRLAKPLAGPADRERRQAWRVDIERLLARLPQ